MKVISNQAVIEKGRQYVMNTYGRFSIALVRGRGARVWDADGKEYLDFTSGIAVCGLGHSHPQLVEALCTQAQALWHCSNLYWIEPQVELAEKLCVYSGMGKAFFANSGAEVNEGAIKLVRKYFSLKGKPACEIIAFRNSFHGRTLGALTATGQEKYHKGFTPLVPGFVYADFNDLKSVEKMVGENTGAIMVEPVQGEGGVNPADPAFLQELRKLCDSKGLLLVLDEVQSGMGRTGKMFAYQHYGIQPDIVTLAKALGGGFPIGALLARDEVAQAFEPGDHASTFGGNPLACAVANRVVDVIGNPEFLDKAAETGTYLRQQLVDIARERQDVVQVRGMGMMLGVEFTQEVKPLVDICLGKGLLLISAGPRVLRFLPPLDITREEIDTGICILKTAIKEWASQ